MATTTEEEFASTLKKRDKYLIRLSDLELNIVDEQDEFRLSENIALANHYQGLIAAANQDLVDFLTPSKKPNLRSNVKFLGIGKRN